MNVFFLDKVGGLGIAGAHIPPNATVLTREEHNALLLVDAYERHTKLAELRAPVEAPAATTEAI